MINRLKAGRLASLKIIAVTLLTFVIAVSVNVRGQVSNSSQSQKSEKTKISNSDVGVQKNKIHTAPEIFKYQELQYCQQKTEQITEKYAVISKEEQFDSTYLYLITTFIDFSNGKLDVEFQKILRMKEGETDFKEPPITIAIINYDEIKAKFPVVSPGVLKKYIKEQKVERKKYCLLGGGMGSKLFKKILTSNTEYWKTH